MLKKEGPKGGREQEPSVPSTHPLLLFTAVSFPVYIMILLQHAARPHSADDRVLTAMEEGGRGGGSVAPPKRGFRNCSVSYYGVFEPFLTLV